MASRAAKISLRFGIGIVALLGLLAVPVGCTTTIRPPAQVQRPVTVYLLDHGMTPSLVLPAEDGGMVRYMFGDWRWYALGNQNAWTGFLALFIPTQGALGRDAFAAVDSVAALRDAVAVEIDEAFPLQVDRTRALALQQQIEQQVNARSDTAVWNDGNRAQFVHHPQRYTYFSNSNHMVAEWLRELGCEVRGPAIYSRWRVKGSAADD
jgi:hypothetical protein